MQRFRRAWESAISHLKLACLNLVRQRLAECLEAVDDDDWDPNKPDQESEDDSDDAGTRNEADCVA